MKKLLLVLLVVALASFLFVGCLPVTPPNGDEGEGEGEPEICPTVAVTTQVEVEDKTYIKGGKQTITVTFAVPTEPVSVYVGWDLKEYIAVFDPGWEVVMYANADKTVYTGDFVFSKDYIADCNEAYIYVETCETCDPCKYPYTVDTAHPYSKIAVTADECSCEGIALTFASTSSIECAVTDVCCDDECSGLASWAIDIYDKDPFDDCCGTPCATPVASGSGACPVDFVTGCLPGYLNGTEEGDKTYYVLTTLLDEVGNQARYYVEIVMDQALDAALAASTKPVAVPLIEYAQGKVIASDVGKPGVCSWFCTEINGDYDTGEYGFCSDSPDNVITGTATDPCGI